MPIIVCADCSVRDKSLCSSLTDLELIRLNVVSRRKVVPRGTTLMWAGDESIICGNLLSGVLKITAATADGREQIVGLLYGADFVGRPRAGELPFSITALTDAELCVFPRAPFESMLDDHLNMERLLLHRTMVALDDARSRMLVLARGTSEEKVAGFLLEMAGRLLADGEATLELPLARGQIADVLGLTIETVSRQMTNLRAAGIIALPGGRLVTLLDRGMLMQRAMII